MKTITAEKLEMSYGFINNQNKISNWLQAVNKFGINMLKNLKITKVFSGIGNFLCQILTQYFLLWCPKERKLQYDRQSHLTKYDQYKDIYFSRTRW